MSRSCQDAEPLVYLAFQNYLAAIADGLPCSLLLRLGVFVAWRLPASLPVLARSVFTPFAFPRLHLYNPLLQRH